MYIHDYPPLDLSPADESDGIKKAVLCESEEEAVWLLAAMMVQYPEKTTIWDFPNANWSCGILGDTFNPTCYNLRIGRDGWMTRGSYDYFTRNGCMIIQFTSLVPNAKDFSQSDMPIESLFT